MIMSKRIIIALLAGLLLLMPMSVPVPVFAHIVPGNYLRLNVEGATITGDWDLSLPSLAEMVDMTGASRDEQAHFAISKLSVMADGKPCTLALDNQQLVDQQGFVLSNAIGIRGECPAPVRKLTVDYFALLVIDPVYQGFIKVTAYGETHTSLLSAQNAYASFELARNAAAADATVPAGLGQPEAVPPDRWQQFRDYLIEGVWHIWLGYDHILFLVTLLLTGALVRVGHHWQPIEGRLRRSFWQVTKIVTAFTLAHSITLGLVIFDVVSLPSRLVESTIAFSIAVAAANNLRPVLHRRLWLLTFGFGLIHGMGFAGALRELGLPDDARLLALVAFNLGVELGQLAIVCVVLPAIFALRHSASYRRYGLPALSAAIIAVALLWFVQRAFAVTLLGGALGT